MGHKGTAVVTGASAGIGEAYARRLAGLGYDLVLVARRGHRLDALAAELSAGPAGARVEVLAADLVSPDGVDAVAARLRAPDVSLLVNNAGINGYGPFAAADPAVLGAVVALNVTAPTLLARAALPGMLEHDAGAIVNVASLLAFSGGVAGGPLPKRATYAATKAYLVAFSRVLAGEVAGTRVTVQVVCPGYTATEFHLTAGADPVRDADAEGHEPDPRAMPADDVAAASLLALERGETVCVPGLEDPSALDRLLAAEAGLRQGSRPRRAARYAH